MASVRFIPSTHSVHRTLEQELSTFLGTEDTILYSSCFDANTGLFETLLDERDAIISDALNHASLIDGIRLCKATRHRYAHSNMDELEAALKASSSSRLRLIATDGVFSMDGDIARLDRIADLADQYDAAVVVDDSHATASWESGAAAPHPIAAWPIVSTSSPARWARRWGEDLEDSRRDGKRSSHCFANARDHIYSPTRCHRSSLKRLDVP